MLSTTAAQIVTRMATQLMARLPGPFWLGTSVNMGAIALFLITAHSAAACEFFSIPQQYNTTEFGDVVVIGYQAERPYRVVVLSDDQDTLNEVRECVTDAFATRSRIGDYIQVASFSRRSDAEVIRRVLRRAGYRSRVVYRDSWSSARF
ncbi:MAG: SPOR domain-containing protein [Phormidesmis sp.]